MYAEAGTAVAHCGNDGGLVGALGNGGCCMADMAENMVDIASEYGLTINHMVNDMGNDMVN